MKKKTLNGHTYTHEVLKKATEIYQEKIKNGTALGVLNNLSCNVMVDGSEIDLSQVSHKITKLFVADGVFLGEFEFIGSKRGLAEQLVLHKSVEIIPSGLGVVDSEGNISNYRLISFNFTNKSAINQQKESIK